MCIGLRLPKSDAVVKVRPGSVTGGRGPTEVVGGGTRGKKRGPEGSQIRTCHRSD